MSNVTVDLLCSQVSKESQGYEPFLTLLTCTEGSTASDLLAEAFGHIYTFEFVCTFVCTFICTFCTGLPFFSPNASPS